MIENKKERIQAIRAMDFLARSINNENILEAWLANGIPDGEITDDTKDEELEWLIDDESLDEITEKFCACMARAKFNGGLFIDGVTVGESRRPIWCPSKPVKR